METTQSTVLSQMTADRCWLHRHPEEGWTEFETTYFIHQRLQSLGYACVTGKRLVDSEHVLGRNDEKVKNAMDRARTEGVPEAFLVSLEGFTGVIAQIDTGRPGPVTVLRFDIDCVCVNETEDPSHVPVKDGFRSEHPGLMHACGHDAHTSVGLAVAKWLKEHEDQLCGTIRLIFQPAEEGTRGALAMAAAGWVDDADYFIASHIGGLGKLGEILIAKGGMLATSKIDLSFTGVASHAGIDPEKGRSALLAAAAASLMIAGIPRHSLGDSRISIGTLHAGEGRNVTPVHASLQIETCGIKTEVNEFIENTIRRIAAGVAESYGVSESMKLAGKALTLPVCPELINLAEEVARTIPNVRKVMQDDRPTASEDCTNFMKRVVDHGGQVMQFVFGANHLGHHRPNFDIQPEAMVYGYEMFTRMILKLNTPH